MVNSRDISLLRDDVEANCRIFLEECKKAGLNVLVTQTVRDNEYQAKLYAQGRTTAGSIVTNAKTVSFHCGLAFDICKNVKGHEYDDASFFTKCAAIAKKIGFSWGGDWKSFKDRPHFQWDDHGKYTDAMVRAGKLPPTMPKYGSTTSTSNGGNTVNVTLPVIKKGSKGASVKAMQQLLIAKGYSCGTTGADGSCGANTVAAIKKYQTAKKLDVDGSCGQKTWNALLTT